jgi:ferredoxin
MWQYIKKDMEVFLMKAFIDRDGCISCGLCIEICPDVFEFADDGLADVSKQPTRSNIHKAHEAAEGCPVQVITVED